MGNPRRDKLKDGKTAQFKDVKFNKVNLGEGDIPIITGYVNSKNSLGGYSGYQLRDDIGM